MAAFKLSPDRINRLAQIRSFDIERGGGEDCIKPKIAGDL